MRSRNAVSVRSPGYRPVRSANAIPSAGSTHSTPGSNPLASSRDAASSRASAKRMAGERSVSAARDTPRTLARRIVMDADGPNAKRACHVPTAESSHSPKLVNATITTSIQYWERIACWASR